MPAIADMIEQVLLLLLLALLAMLFMGGMWRLNHELPVVSRVMR